VCSLRSSRERRRGYETLRDTRSKLAYAFDVQEQERRSIARERHDGIVQQLTLVGLSLDEPGTGRFSGKRIASEQGTAGRCKWCQKLFLNEMLRTWLGS
jgi:signal transduction histidine kinase